MIQHRCNQNFVCDDDFYLFSQENGPTDSGESFISYYLELLKRLEHYQITIRFFGTKWPTSKPDFNFVRFTEKRMKNYSMKS